MPVIWTIDEDYSNTNLLTFIHKKTKLPIVYLYKLLRKNAIKVDQMRAKGNIKIFTGQKVTLLNSKEIEHTKKPVFSPPTHITNNIIFETPLFLLINKPAGIPSQHGTNVQHSIQYSLNALALETELDYFMLHRLDKETSGTLIISKKLQLAREIQNDFVMRKIKKVYLCILSGVIDREKHVSTPIDVDNKQKEAFTIFTPICNNGKDTVVLSTIYTGRKHQIRKHALDINSHVVGDNKYGIKTKDLMYLHSVFTLMGRYKIFSTPNKAFLNHLQTNFNISLQTIIDLFI